ncbi:glycoside hydrolase family 28 protein [Enterobacteriaceae endosymbiont of Neohaemonia nigricornis]|uniref:glycoside hydrolase family 28 protein n=1 Tax=Enterobacteriaceae endosymbiont of Neohaemonia nigricornis TaxID=2675792 RepID=UPI0014491324|nr:glycoside hydrolase family 28 protein [Enterobacteriaceae endosymbiont of Neohaemonia nigricornis]QJC30404.1 glycoside hydrolase family 28 protein [Enterobacteriaceae endosymbiont of Neohaemonia nigricornis]
MFNYKKFNLILNNINIPVFKKQKFYLKTYFDKISNNYIDISQVINSAIIDCHNNGGGTVIIPDGEFYCGPIHLKSNVNLFLCANTIIKFFTDPKKYFNVLTRWEGIDCINYTPLIYAYNQTNIAITGYGTLDGQASLYNWWSWKKNIDNTTLQDKDVKLLIHMMENNIPINKRIFGYNHFLRPNFIQLYLCSNILITGITIINSPMWEIHPLLSNNIYINNVTINSIGPNNDGCNPESCSNVLIDNCYFNTGDDCIAIKSGKNSDGRKINIASKNIIIQNCLMNKGHGAIVLGSECTGGINNIFIRNCKTIGEQLQSFLRIKNNAVRGGIINNIYITDINIQCIKSSFLNINLLYDEGQNGTYLPKIYNIYINNIYINLCYRVIDINSFIHSFINNIFLQNSIFKNIKYPSKIQIFNKDNLINFNNVKFL